MGKIDISLADFFSDMDRYADLINVYIFHGRRVVKAVDILEKDSRVTGILRRLGNRKRRHLIQKYRDIVRRIVFGTHIVVLGLEHQEHIHYAMPVRILMEDAAEYDEQMRKIQKRHRRLKDLHGAEYIGSFSKQDRINPILTIVIYYGEEPWTGPKDLYEMMDLESIPEEIKERINNYPIYILEVRSYPDIEKFQSDIREVFGFVQTAKDKDALMQFVEKHREQFEHLEEDAYDLIAALTGSAELADSKMQRKNEGGTFNMCEGIRALIEDGIQRGKIDGIRQGGRSKAETVAHNMFLRGMTAEDTAAICEEDIELIRSWFDGWRK